MGFGVGVPINSTLTPTGPMAWPNCAVSLVDYVRAVGYNEAAFWGVFYTGQELNDCATLWLEPQRLAVADALAQAQLMIENIVGFPLCPRWFEDNQPACHNPLITRWGQLLVAGQQATSVVAAGAVVDYTTDPAVVGPIATTATDSSELHIYLPGTDREIIPFGVTLSGGAVTFLIPRVRLVADPTNPKTGYDFTVLANFTATVDVKRIVNVTTTTATLLNRATNCAVTEASACFRIEDARRGFIRVSRTGDTAPCPQSWRQYAVNLYYKAGLTTLPLDLKNAIIRLAHTLMPESICNQCDQIHRLWSRDTNVPAIVTRERINNPFGASDGAWFAYKVAQSNKLWRGGCGVVATKIRAIKAKAPNVGKARLELLNELRSVGGAIKDDFEATTAMWQHKPKFDLKISLAGSEPSVTVTTADKVFGYQDEGTRPHIIRPKQAKVLRFPVKGEMVFTQIVHHPGTKARKYSEKITRKWRGEFGKRMLAALKRAAIATGHGR